MHNAGDASEVEKKLKKIGAEYLILEKDISKEEDVCDIYNLINSTLGTVDILVNNAAFNDEDGNDTIHTLTQNVIDQTFAVNVRGTLLMTREMVKQSKDGGRIINLSTDSAQVFPGQITYGLLKLQLKLLQKVLH